MPFQAGDVVVRARAARPRALNMTLDVGTVGTVCRVVTDGSLYKVRFEGTPMCLSAFEDSLNIAPPGTVGPDCEADC